MLAVDVGPCKSTTKVINDHALDAIDAGAPVVFIGGIVSSCVLSRNPKLVGTGVWILGCHCKHRTALEIQYMLGALLLRQNHVTCLRTASPINFTQMLDSVQKWV